MILGGSQAAKVFAEVLPKIFKECNNANIALKIYQQCLPEQNEFLTSYYQDLKIDNEILWGATAKMVRKILNITLDSNPDYEPHP